MTVFWPSFYFPLRDASFPYAAPSNPKSDPIPTILFFSLQILGGHIGVPSILLTLLFSKSVKRHPMLINFLCTWVIYSTSFCILLYLGKQFGPEPAEGLCVLQASSIYGTAVLTSTAGFSFVLNLWLNLRDMEKSRAVSEFSSWRKYMLLLAPYVVFVVFLIFTAAFGASEPDQVSRNRYMFYCTIHNKIVNTVPAISAVIMLGVVILEASKGLIAVKLYRMHKAFVQLRTTGGPPLDLFIRVGIFSTYSFLAITACAAFWSATGDKLPYYIQASLPTAAFVVFGTQRDLLEVWGVIRVLDWLRRKPKAVQVKEVQYSSKPTPITL